MDRDELLKEMAAYSADDLELILETQKDLYEPGELALIRGELQKKKAEEQEKILARLPKEIACEKCGGMNEFENQSCKYCKYPLDKRKYYREGWDEQEEEDAEEEKGESYGFHYVISFLIPLVGFIVGAILLGKDTAEQRAVGKTCIILGIVSVVAAALLWTIL